MTKPVRLQLSRRAGFDLQAHSFAVNGLAAVNVARPGRWGNPFTVENSGRVDAVLRFACEVAPMLAVQELKGKNLACWCKPGDQCHADILLDLANHRWSGWPGAWCMDCGCEDVTELALADNVNLEGRMEDVEARLRKAYPDHPGLVACKEPGSKRHDPYAARSTETPL